MIILNIIYVLIITSIAIVYLNKRSKVIANPCSKRGRMLVEGTELFWILTFSTGLMAFSGDVGLDLMAIRLMILEVLCISAIVLSHNRPIWTPSLNVYAIFICWMVIGLTYGLGGLYGVRVILKYLYPPIVALCASSIVRDYEVFLSAGKWARWVALASFVFAITHLEFLIPGVFWYGTARAINYISIMVFSMALFFEGAKSSSLRNLMYAVLFIIPCFYWVYRTSIMGSLVAIMAFSFIKWKIRSLPIIAGVLIAGVLAVFFIPSLNEKMFRKGSGVTLESFQEKGVTEDDIDNNGRQAMWEYFQERFYENSKLTGSGTGSVQQHFYSHFLFGGLKVIHSDFVQQKCDNGLIGLVLYGLASVMIFFHCASTYWNAKDPRLRVVAITAGASIVGVFVTHYSDNVVNYSMATLSMPWGFYGMMLGIKHKLEKAV